MIYFSYATAWVSTSVAAISVMYFAHSAWCLWAFSLPACIDFPCKCENSDESEESEDEQSED